MGKKIKILAANVMIISQCLPAMAVDNVDELPRNQKILQGLVVLANSRSSLQTTAAGNKLDMNGLTATRGGSDTGKPLGLYILKNPIVFSSEYKKTDVVMQCKFAYDLGEFVEKSGGGWHNYLKANANSEQQERAFVPYKSQEEYARFWWEKYDKKFHDMGWFWKDGFVYEAILDGTNLFNYWYRKQPGVFPSAEANAAAGEGAYLLWSNLALSKLVEKK